MKLTVSKLIHALIGERARSIALQRALGNVIVLNVVEDHDQARREIEAGYLTKHNTKQPARKGEEVK